MRQRTRTPTKSVLFASNLPKDPSHAYPSPMNTLEYYTKQKDPWSDKELQELRTGYAAEKGIGELADELKRTPGSVAYRLQLLGVVTTSVLARGYAEYRASPLFREVSAVSKAERAEKKQKKETTLKERIETKLLVEAGKNIIQSAKKKHDGADLETLQEVQALREEVKGLRDDIKEVLRLMNVVYEFSTEE
jgi:hypothetical protein